MKAGLGFVALGSTLCALMGATGSVRAQTVLDTLNHSNPAAFTYGNQQFAITGCLFNTATCSGSDNARVIAVFSGRGGTEIEIAPVTGSAIYSGTGTYTLSFNLQVSPLTGSQGISRITDILTGTDTSSRGDTGVYGAVTGTGSTGFSQIKSIIGAATTSQTFTLQQYPNTANFSVSMGVTATTGQTLTLTNVALLLNPAPEPASIALFGVGVAGLAAVRRRFGRRTKPAIAANS